VKHSRLVFLYVSFARTYYLKEFFVQVMYW
jgi:hypothetical protein